MFKVRVRVSIGNDIQTIKGRIRKYSYVYIKKCTYIFIYVCTLKHLLKNIILL